MEKQMEAKRRINREITQFLGAVDLLYEQMRDRTWKDYTDCAFCDDPEVEAVIARWTRLETRIAALREEV